MPLETLACITPTVFYWPKQVTRLAQIQGVGNTPHLFMGGAESHIAEGIETGIW